MKIHHLDFLSQIEKSILFRRNSNSLSRLETLNLARVTLSRRCSFAVCFADFYEPRVLFLKTFISFRFNKNVNSLRTLNIQI